LGFRTVVADGHAEEVMTWIHMAGAVVAGALLIYLLCALLKPEWFQ